MQNLFLKILVLMFVVGGSCFVVWKAHESLSGVAASQLDAKHFVSVDQPPENDVPSHEVPTHEVPGEFAGEPQPTLAEPEPTLARSAPQTEMISQLGAASFPADRHTEVVRELPPQNSEDHPESAEPAGLTSLFADSETRQLSASRSRMADTAPVFPEPEPIESAPSSLPKQKTEEDAGVPGFLVEAVEEPSTPPSQTESTEEHTLLTDASPEPASAPAQPASELAANMDSDPFGAFPAAERSSSLPPRELPTLPEPEPLPATMPRNDSSLAAIEITEEPSAARSTVADSTSDPFGSVTLAVPPQTPANETLSSREELSVSDSSVMNAGAIRTEESRIETTSAVRTEMLPVPAAGQIPEPRSLPDWSDVPSSSASPARAPAALEVPVLPEVIPARSRMATPEPLEHALTLPPQSLPSQPAPTLAPTLAAADSAGLPVANADFPPLPPLGAPTPAPQGGATKPAVVPVSEEVLPGLPVVQPAIPATAQPMGTATPTPASSGAPSSVPKELEVLPELEITPLSKPTATPAIPDRTPVLSEPTPILTNPSPTPTGTMRSPFPPEALPSGPASPIDPALIGTAEPEPATSSDQQSPELKIEKLAPPEAVIGESLIYAIVIRNVGSSTARDVVVEDRIPKGTQLVGTIPQANLNDGKLTWQLGTLAGGEERKIQLKVIPFESGQIGSVATVSFAASVSASIKVSAPQLTITMAGPQEAVLGEHVKFQFKLKNQGQGIAKSVFLRAILPPGLKHPGGNDLEYEAGTLTPGAEKVIELIVTPEQVGQFTPSAQVSNDNKVHSETRSNLNVIRARLELTRTGPENRFVGRPTPVATKITNHGTQRLTNLVVQEKLPAGVDVATLPRGARWDQNKRLLTWTVSQLEPGESQEMSSLLISSKGGIHQGTLVAVDDSGNRAEIPTMLNVKGFAELQADVKASERTIMIGERISFRLTLKNVGTEAAREVRPRFLFPDGFEFANAAGPTKFAVHGQTVEFESIPELSVAGEKVYEIALIAHAPTTSKVTVQLESADYAAPLQSDQPVRVVANTP